MVWAQSSIKVMPWSRHMLLSRSMSQMCPRMCDKKQGFRTAAVGLFLEVIKVDRVIVGHVHEHRARACMVDGAGHLRQPELLSF